MALVPPAGLTPVFLSAFTESLDGRAIGVSQAKVNELLIGYSVLYRRLQRAISKGISSLETYNDRRFAEGWKEDTKGKTTEVLDDYLECVYIAAELYEYYESDIPKLLKVPSGKLINYRSRLSKLKRECVVICNRCKHNHAFLQCIERIFPDGTGIAGFAVYRMENDVAQVESQIHKHNEAFSFNWSYRRLIGNLMAADDEAGSLTRSIPNKPGESVSALTFTLPLFNEMNKILEMSPLAMPMEKCSPSISTGEASFDLLETDECAPSEAADLRAYIDVISHKLSFQAPYVSGNADLTMRNEGDPGKPIPGYIRVVMNYHVAGE